MGELHTSQHKETSHPATPRELYREKIGFQDYVITDEEPEVIEKWKVDVWWGRRNRAGLFQKEAEYEKKKNMARHLCGFAS